MDCGTFKAFINLGRTSWSCRWEHRQKEGHGRVDCKEDLPMGFAQSHSSEPMMLLEIVLPMGAARAKPLASVSSAAVSYPVGRGTARSPTDRPMRELPFQVGEEDPPQSFWQTPSSRCGRGRATLWHTKHFTALSINRGCAYSPKPIIGMSGCHSKD